MHAWGIYETISTELRAHALRAVAEAVGVPEWVPFLRWSPRERVFWYESSSGSRMATVDVDAGTIRYSERLGVTELVQPLNYNGPVLWWPHSRVSVAMAEARRAVEAPLVPCDPPTGYGLDRENGDSRMRAAVREAFTFDPEPESEARRG